jgi:hypothetical protein
VVMFTLVTNWTLLVEDLTAQTLRPMHGKKGSGRCRVSSSCRKS